jgi:hypothetical protein
MNRSGRGCRRFVVVQTTWLGLLLALVFTPATEAARRFHLAPAQRGDGSGRDAANARAFDGNDLNYRIFADGSDPVVELRFAPGIYSAKTFLFVGGGGNAADYFVRMMGDGSRPEDVVIRNDQPFVPGVQDRMLRFEDLRRVEIENLTFDGNWGDKMRQATHPILTSSYKNQPISITARTGRIRRVIVRNHGSVGIVPQTRFDNSAGVEAFPLAVGTVDVGQEPEGGDPRPWVVEDCEVHGFHAEYNGYGTMIMAGAGNVPGQTPTWAGTEAGRRLFLIRRNLVRGTPTGAGVIALGSAGCSPGEVDGGRVTFTDNLVVNASMGFNTDCGRLTDLDFINSLFLDIWIQGNVNASFAGMMQRYQVSGNSVRFGLRRGYPVYSRLEWNGPRATSQPGLVLGRRQTNELVGLFVGAPSAVRFSGNWFTTRSPQRSGAEALPAEFQLARKLTQADMPWSTTFADALDFDASDNAISGVPMDFKGLDEVPLRRLARLTHDSAPELLRNRRVTRSTSAFPAIGRIERVLPVWGTRRLRYEWTAAADTGTRRQRSPEVSEPALVGGIEVMIGEPFNESADELRIPVRLAVQPLPGRGETRPLVGSNVWLEVTGTTPRLLAAVTDRRGIAVFKLPTEGLAPVRLQLRAFHDPEARSAAEGRFDEYRVAFSLADYALGTLVGVTASPDVADEKSGQPGRLKFFRTPDTNGALPEQEIYFRVGGEGRSARIEADYRLVAVGGFSLRSETARLGGIARLTFPKDADAVEVDVIPMLDDVLEREWMTVRLLPGVRRTYGLAADASATVILYDGPEWTRKDLPAPSGYTARPTAIGPVVRVGELTEVIIGGTLVARDGESERSAWWRWDLAKPDPEFLPEIPSAWTSVRPRVIAGTSPDGWPWIGGETGPAIAPKPWWSGVAFNGNGAVTRASPDGAWWVGWRAQGRDREALLGRTSATPIVARGSGWERVELKSVNATGRVAGEGFRLGRRRAFRSNTVRALSESDLLPMPAGSDESGVEAIDAAGSAAGWCGSATGRQACLWPASAPNTEATVIELGRPDGLPESRALGFASNGDVLAVAGKGGRPEVPYLHSATTRSLLQLNDPAFVWGTTAAEPAGDAVAINPQGWIIGNRTGPQGPVGWIARRLVKQ